MVAPIPAPAGGGRGDDGQAQHSTTQASNTYTRTDRRKNTTGGLFYVPPFSEKFTIIIYPASASKQASMW